MAESVQVGFVLPEIGAVVIDVGINRLADGSLVGDVDFEGVRQKASYITAVPGGVGPMTVAMLIYNTVNAAEHAVRARCGQVQGACDDGNDRGPLGSLPHDPLRAAPLSIAIDPDRSLFPYMTD